jgi:ribulose-phosphate 3-epimerase
LCDFGNLEREIRLLEEAGVPGFHLDVMDGHFVPNLSYGLPIVETVRRLSTAVLDVHLMIANPQQYVAAYREAGADVITIHAEAADDPGPILEGIRELGGAAGLAISPGTSTSVAARYAGLCDLVLVMSVEPGFGGQSFQRPALEKLAQLRAALPGGVMLEIDGGVNEENIAACGAAGADLFVVGSAVFRTNDYQASVSRLRELAGSRRGGDSHTQCCTLY